MEYNSCAKCHLTLPLNCLKRIQIINPKTKKLAMIYLCHVCIDKIEKQKKENKNGF